VSSAVEQDFGGRGDPQLRALRAALKAAVNRDLSVRLPSNAGSTSTREIASNFNRLLALNAEMANEITRVEQAVRGEGRMSEIASLLGATGSWLLVPQSVNALINGLVQPSTEVAGVISAVAEGDLTQKMALESRDSRSRVSSSALAPQSTLWLTS